MRVPDQRRYGPDHPCIKRSARLNEMAQTSSATIVGYQASMEYAKLCMSMRSGNARYSADPGVG